MLVCQKCHRVPCLCSASPQRVPKEVTLSEKKTIGVGIDTLSPREYEIADWVVQGKSNIEIGMILAVSPLTVKNHVQSMLRKAGCDNRAHLVFKYMQMREQELLCLLQEARRHLPAIHGTPEVLYLYARIQAKLEAIDAHRMGR